MFRFEFEFKGLGGAREVSDGILLPGDDHEEGLSFTPRAVCCRMEEASRVRDARGVAASRP